MTVIDVRELVTLSADQAENQFIGPWNTSGSWCTQGPTGFDLSPTIDTSWVEQATYQPLVAEQYLL